MEAMFGSSLVKGDESTVNTSDIVANDSIELIGIYFSAHWCPPCRGFTPKLADFYKAVNANGQKLEIVFVSHDRDESSFKSYLSEMPWCAIPFSGDELKQKLIEDHKVSGIPTLVFIGKDGAVKFADGRGKVSEEGSASKFPWK